IGDLTIEIKEPKPIRFTAVASAFTCDQDYSLVTATIDATNIGTPPYTYSFDDGAFQAESFKHFPYGTGLINVEVKDANGCTEILTVTVPDESKFTASFTPIQQINCNNGEELIDIVIQNGSGN